MDAALVEVVARRIAAWMETASACCRNAEYWRDRFESARMALGRLLPCLDADHAACMPHAMEALSGLDLALAALGDACS